MSEQVLAIEHLDARYGQFQALFDVSLSIDTGDVLAIIGANGAGKSTLLRSIAGLIPAPPGAIRFRGNPIGNLSPDAVVKQGIVMVPEGRRLFPSLSVEENLIIGGQLGRPGRWSLERIYSLFPILRDRRKAPATSLSGGQQQMCAIGRGLMANPDLIMFDEISLGLAPVVIKEIYRALPGVIAEGTTAIIVEQDITQALSVATRVLCLQEGRITLQGKPAELDRASISTAYFGR